MYPHPICATIKLEKTRQIRNVLLNLRVKNFGIIEDFDWSPASGFNVLTGETGAGKSLVVDAVTVLLSGITEDTTIRHGADELRIEGLFDVSSRLDVIQWLKDKGLDPSDGTAVVSLNLRRGGRTVLRLNTQTIPRNVIAEFGQKLIDIHGQSQHLSLLNKSSHLDFLDTYAGTLKIRQEFTQKASQLAQLEQEIKKLDQHNSERLKQADFLRFQLQEIEQAELHEGEDSDLEREQLVLASTENLKDLSFKAIQALDGDDISGESSAASNLSQAVSAVESLSEIDNKIQNSVAPLREALCNVTETLRELRSYYASLEFDPKQLEITENRLSVIKDLKRKYGSTIEDIVAYAEKAGNQLNEVDTFDERMQSMRHNSISLMKEMGQIASELSSVRKAAASRLIQSVNEELTDLGMDKVKFDISLSVVEKPDGVPLPDGLKADYNNHGIDNVEFLASTNIGEPPHALAKIASTGELSRFTLAVKTALSESDKTPVLIFDEIDIGVGGRSGDVIGRKLSNLSSNHQVICVTHLPQIACYADHHYIVDKITEGGRTHSRLKSADADTRTRELALMLSGDKNSETAEAGAKELINRADSFKGRNKRSIT